MSMRKAGGVRMIILARTTHESGVVEKEVRVGNVYRPSRLYHKWLAQEGISLRKGTSKFNGAVKVKRFVSGRLVCPKDAAGLVCEEDERNPVDEVLGSFEGVGDSGSALERQG